MQDDGETVSGVTTENEGTLTLGNVEPVTKGTVSDKDEIRGRVQVRIVGGRAGQVELQREPGKRWHATSTGVADNAVSGVRVPDSVRIFGGPDGVGGIAISVD